MSAKLNEIFMLWSRFRRETIWVPQKCAAVAYENESPLALRHFRSHEIWLQNASP